MDKRTYKRLQKQGWDESYTGIYQTKGGTSFWILEWSPDVFIKARYYETKTMIKRGYFFGTRIYPEKAQKKSKRPENTKYPELPRKWKRLYLSPEVPEEQAKKH